MIFISQSFKMTTHKFVFFRNQCTVKHDNFLQITIPYPQIYYNQKLYSMKNMVYGTTCQS